MVLLRTEYPAVLACLKLYGYGAGLPVHATVCHARLGSVHYGPARGIAASAGLLRPFNERCLQSQDGGIPCTI